MERTEITISFGSAVELDHFLDAEPFDELLPDLWSKAVAEYCGHAVRLVVGPRWHGEEVAAHLADVLGGL